VFAYLFRPNPLLMLKRNPDMNTRTAIPIAEYHPPTKETISQPAREVPRLAIAPITNEPNIQASGNIMNTTNSATSPESVERSKTDGLNIIITAPY
jgi:hypothetical protein